MKTNMNRRDFLKGTAWMGAAAMAAGCQMNRFGFGQGGQMQDYAYQKLKGKKIRVGFVGIGSCLVIAMAVCLVALLHELLGGLSKGGRGCERKEYKDGYFFHKV